MNLKQNNRYIGLATVFFAFTIGPAFSADSPVTPPDGAAAPLVEETSVITNGAAPATTDAWK